MKIKGSVDNKFIRENPDPMAPATLLMAEEPKWEYRSVLLPRGTSLNPLGSKGWELVGTVSYPGDQVMFYFKRRRP